MLQRCGLAFGKVNRNIIQYCSAEATHDFEYAQHDNYSELARQSNNDDDGCAKSWYGSYLQTLAGTPPHSYRANAKLSHAVNGSAAALLIVAVWWCF